MSSGTAGGDSRAGSGRGIPAGSRRGRATIDRIADAARRSLQDVRTVLESSRSKVLPSEPGTAGTLDAS
jgi:hypothetical protein